MTAGALRATKRRLRFRAKAADTTYLFYVPLLSVPLLSVPLVSVANP